jgi:hypothetical protein
MVDQQSFVTDWCKYQVFVGLGRRAIFERSRGRSRSRSRCDVDEKEEDQDDEIYFHEPPDNIIR